MPFRNNIVSCVLGQSGGIWIMWMEGPITSHEIAVSLRFIHILVEHDPKARPMELTAVYMPPQLIAQTQVWQALHHLSNSFMNPWILIGDFNIILGPREKLGVKCFQTTRAKPLRNFMTTHNIHDLGFCGSSFTWKANYPLGTMCMKR